MSASQRPLLPTRLEYLAAGFAAAVFCVIQCILKSSKALREEMGELMDRAEAITQLAIEEKRDLTAAERSEIDAILGVGKPGEAGFKPGKIHELENDARRMEAIENRSAELKKNRLGDPLTPQTGEPPADPPPATIEDRVAKVVIPIQHQHRYGKLKNFRGPLAEKRAYVAGRWFLATLFKHEASQQWCQEQGIAVVFNALQEKSNHLGGFLVPAELEQTIIDLREEYGVFRRNSFIVPMAGDTKNQPRRTSGLTAYFVGENLELTESEKNWDLIELVARKVGCLARYSNELDEDAIISLGDDLTGEIAYAFANKEDACGFVGDGTSAYGKIVGVVNALAAGSIVEAAAGNTSFETLDLTDFESCVGKLPRYPGIQPKWYISQAGWAASMLRLLDAAGGNSTAQLQQGAQLQFLGYPVEISQVLNDTLGADASKVKALFGDLRMGTTFGNRRGISVMLSEHRYFEFDQIGIKGTERFDIAVHGRGTATEAGPIVALKTPAA